MDSLAEYVDLVGSRNGAEIAMAARAIAATSAAGGLVRPTGAGHSLAAVLETFFRAGGLAFVRPIWHPRVLPFYGARTATAASLPWSEAMRMSQPSARSMP